VEYAITPHFHTTGNVYAYLGILDSIAETAHVMMKVRLLCVVVMVTVLLVSVYAAPGTAVLPVAQWATYGHPIQPKIMYCVPVMTMYVTLVAACAICLPTTRLARMCPRAMVIYQWRVMGMVHAPMVYASVNRD
jgi:hypothetical protein